LGEIRGYFASAKQKGEGIRFEQKTLWTKIENTVDAWIVDVCADKHLNGQLVGRTKEAIVHRLRNLMAKTIRESLGKR
jgi:hypothetical protein